MDFKLDVSNYFGLDYQTYIDNLQAFALTHPSDYYKLRAMVLTGVKKENMIMIYDLFFNLLTEGTKSDGTSYNDDTIVDFTSAQFKPSMSKQNVSEIAASAVKTMEKMINEAIDKILPADHLHIANSVTSRKADASLFTG
jgi:hypothetical protein